MSGDPVSLIALFRTLADCDQTTFILTPERMLLRCNAAWDRFVLANRGDHLLAREVRGTFVLAAISPSLRAFYAAGFDHACRSGERWEQDYECSSDQVFRTFRMVAYPFGDWLLVTHVLVVEHAHDREAFAPGEAYERDGVIMMCSHCRLVRHTTAPRWDWVPDLVANMPSNVSHGLCPSCTRYYYPDLESPP